MSFDIDWQHGLASSPRFHATGGWHTAAILGTSCVTLLVARGDANGGIVPRVVGLRARPLEQVSVRQAVVSQLLRSEHIRPAIGTR